MNQHGKIVVMLCCFSICGIAAGIHHNFFRREPVKQTVLYEVVYNQLNAFRVSEYSRAYQHVSADFQQKFSMEQFIEMIGRDYSMVLSTERIEFGVAQLHGNYAIIQVFFVDPNGRVIPCVYSLVNEADTWKIDGLQFSSPWRIGQRLTGIRS